MSDWGFVYILGNPVMPGVYKIGMTHRSPTQRCIELSNSTSVPMPFVLLCFGEVQCPRELEVSLHDQFREHRVWSGREFFRASFETASTCLREQSEHFCMTDAGEQLLYEFLLESDKNRPVALRLVGAAELDL